MNLFTKLWIVVSFLFYIYILVDYSKPLEIGEIILGIVKFTPLNVVGADCYIGDMVTFNEKIFNPTKFVYEYIF